MSNLAWAEKKAQEYRQAGEIRLAELFEDVIKHCKLIDDYIEMED